jgi:hypothetical protein
VAYGLTRLLRGEDDWTNLLTYLAERDPEPLRTELGLGQGSLRVDREQRIFEGREDAVVRLDGRPAALLEAKLTAGAHDGQFDAYDVWADDVGLPAARRYVIGPNTDPIPGEPPTWCRDHTIPSLLDAWAHRSDDVLARLLAIEAAAEFRALDSEANGPADRITNPISDRLRIRRLYGLMAAQASPGIEFFTEKSESGTANFAAHRAVGPGRVAAEIQRSGKRGKIDCPWALRLMIGTSDGGRAASEALADRHERWLTTHAFIEHAGPDVAALVAEPNGDGFKYGRRGGRGSERYYGNQGVGQGSQTLLHDDVELTDMAAVAVAALRYLMTF